MRLALVAVLLPGACAGTKRPTDGSGSDADSDTDAETDTGVPCDLDEDGDGFPSEECGGPDCDDGDPTIHPGAPLPEWEKEFVDHGSNSLSSNAALALAIDDEGVAHLRYNHEAHGVGDESRYASNLTGVWQNSPVERTLGHTRVSELAVDPEGTVHLAYLFHVDGEGYSVRYGRYDGVEWITMIVYATIGSFDDSVGIALDLDGAVHIGYAVFESVLEGGEWHDGEEIGHATNAGGEWTVERVQPMGGGPFAVSIAVDADGTVRIPYVGGANGRARLPPYALRQASRSDDAFWLDDLVTDTIDEGRDLDAWGGDCCTDMTIDPEGVAHLGSLGGRLGYSTDRGGAWRSEPATDLEGQDFRNNSLAVAPDGTVHMSYVGTGLRPGENLAHREVGHVWGRMGAWEQETLDGWYAGGADSEIAVDVDGGVHIAYIDGDLRVIYAHRPVDPEGVDRDCSDEDLE